MNKGKAMNDKLNNDLPPITNRLGSHWKQPSRKNILVDDTHALMSEEDEAKLLVYNGTFPTGVYIGKMFKRGDYLVWFSAYSDKEVANNYREIIVVR